MCHTVKLIYIDKVVHQVLYDFFPSEQNLDQRHHGATGCGCHFGVSSVVASDSRPAQHRGRKTSFSGVGNARTNSRPDQPTSHSSQDPKALLVPTQSDDLGAL